MKRLVICCDGTWNRADQEHDGQPCPTNVVKLAFRVAKADGAVPQIIHYDQGVGTGNAIDRLTGGAFGDGLEDNIFTAYRFLTANYVPGDELYFFGYSRGAYTVRSVVGMVRKCGILSRGAVREYGNAIALYRDDQHPGQEGPSAFRKAHSVTGDQPIPVKCIGVWDTVGALGIPLRGLRWLTRSKHQFHDVELSGIVEHAYHALAIDERRAPFEATRWAYTPKQGQTVEQRWFVGAHGDVGGGNTDSGLSDIALSWMRDKAQAVGLRIDADVDASYKPVPDPMGKIHESKKGVYRLTKGIDRVIGPAASKYGQPDRSTLETDPTQGLHESVYARWDGDSGYRPRNLREYFRRVGDPRGSAP